MSDEKTAWNPDEVMFEGIAETPIVSFDLGYESRCDHCQTVVSPNTLICPECGQPVELRLAVAHPPGVRDVVFAVLLAIFTVVISLPVNLGLVAVIVSDFSRRAVLPAVMLALWNGWFFCLPLWYLAVTWKKTLATRHPIRGNYWRQYWRIQAITMIPLVAFTCYLITFLVVRWWHALQNPGFDELGP